MTVANQDIHATLEDAATYAMLERLDRLERVRTRLVTWLYNNAPSRMGRPCERWDARHRILVTVEDEIRALLLAL